VTTKNEARLERVLVTGASRGIGRALAEQLLAAGRHVAAVARDAASLDALVQKSDGRAIALAADLTRTSDVEHLVARAIDGLGGVDALVACAGIAHHRPLTEIDAAHIDEYHALHVRAPLLLSRDIASHLRERSASGAIVFVSSTLALQGVPHTSAYAASKGALISLTRSLAVELAPHIRVACVAPGVIDTDMIRGTRSDEDVQALAVLHPLGRLGQADEIAEAIRYLLDARFATGTVLVVDGGITAT
jgi:3-oxoacyl-[acyl-carrier protein] reductase